MSNPLPANCTYHGKVPVRASLSGQNVVMIPGAAFTLSFHSANTYFAKLVTAGKITVNSGQVVIP